MKAARACGEASRGGRAGPRLWRSARGLPARFGHALQVAALVVYWTVTFQLLRRLRQRRNERLVRRLALSHRQLLDRAAEFADAGRARRVLVVDRRMPTPDRDSGSVRMLAVLKLLRGIGHEVTFVSDSEERMPGYEAPVRNLGVEVLYGRASAARHLSASGPDYGCAILSRPEVAERFAYLVRAHALRARLVYDSVDLHWVRLERAAEVSGDPRDRAQAERYRQLEGLACASADLTLAVTPEERATLEREWPGLSVEVLPNIHEVVARAPPWSERRDLMFIGGFEHKPNVDGVEWFAGEVLPLIRKSLPGVAFDVVGNKSKKKVARLASAAVRVHGYVPDAAPFFERCRVFVSPLRYGAGMKGKIGQSMGRGLPVVTTSVGAEGMMLVDGENALVAGDPAAFAAAVVRLYRDELLWSRLSRNGIEHVREHFGEEAALRRMKEIFPLARPGGEGTG